MTAEITPATLFNERRPALEAARQSAVRAARERFDTLRAAQLALWEQQRDAAYGRLEKAKAPVAELPEQRPADAKAGKAWDDAWDELRSADAEATRLRAQPDGRDLLAQLDADTQAADAAFLAAEDALRRELDIAPVNLGTR